MTDAILTDERVLALAAKVRIEPGLPDRPGNPPARVRAEWTDGTVIEAAADGPPELNVDGVRAKFLECTEFGRLPEPEGLWDWLAAAAGTVGQFRSRANWPG
ncbi:hypothetical protein AADG42_06320 [Ammonicoccus fulvus]|uniref:Uncharacterized protein n=1 Tax=Ammonicoccus fulvus TaxID=3138240 RepID=A0ABZ3FQA1_9ACTN